MAVTARALYLHTYVFMSISCGSAGKNSACNARDLGLIPGLGRSPGEGKGYPLQNSDLENSMDCIVHGVSKTWTQLSYFHTHMLKSFNQSILKTLTDISNVMF